ncbi:MAG: hypothetical protein ACKO6N_12785 [Myxococcota bacterium]
MIRRHHSMAILAFLLPGSALAMDDNIRLANLYDESRPDAYWNINSDVSQQALLQNMARDLGMALSTQMVSPAETLGPYGFELGLDTRMLILPSTRVTNDSGDQAAYDRADHWRVMDDDHRLTLANAVMLPTLRLRKGLPYSTEAGIDVTWFGFSQQAALSGYGRVAFHEGMWGTDLGYLPDVAFTLGASSMLGNTELGLSSWEWNLTAGWTLPVAGIRDSHVGNASLFFGVGRLRVTLVPETGLSDRLDELAGYTGSTGAVVSSPVEGQREVLYSDVLSPYKLNLGLRITSGMFRWAAGVEVLAGASNAPIMLGDTDLTPTVGVLSRPRLTFGTGFVY